MYFVYCSPAAPDQPEPFARIAQDIFHRLQQRVLKWLAQGVVVDTGQVKRRASEFVVDLELRALGEIAAGVDAGGLEFGEFIRTQGRDDLLAGSSRRETQARGRDRADGVGVAWRDTKVSRDWC